jgi:glycosyltransferase involved in cell wall biosynthesis
LTIRVIKNSPNKAFGSVSILIPMRNEADNVKACLSSILQQKGLDSFEVIALDDGSTDATANEIKAFPSVKLTSGERLPDKWLGKLWACQQLAEKSSGDYLVFIDADVRLSDYAVANSISKMGKWDFISPYPRQLTSGFVQKIFQPLLQWSWLASVPLLIAQKYSIKSMAVANGQFLIIKRDAYFQSGAHAGIKTEVLDDLMLARRLLKQGFNNESELIQNKTRVAIESSGGYPEFFRGDWPTGDLINTYIHDVRSFDINQNVERFNRVAQPPQIIQGWTVAAYSWLTRKVI